MAVRAVATTGIYCRPTCSAQPLERNVSAFPNRLAAEAAGYRSCLRCRPDRQPLDLPGGAPAPVVAALAAISDGYLDRHDEDDLARHVGYSARQLRRLFERHVGATPAFVARSRRAHFARRLLDETDLPMPVVARAAGFNGPRQMHRTVSELFGFAPSELRAKRRRHDVLATDGGLRLRLPFAGRLDRTGLRRHLEPRVTPGVESIDGDVYRRTLVTCGNPGVLEVHLDGDEPWLSLTAHLPTFDSIIDDVSRIRTMFGLDDDLAGAETALRMDPMLGPLVRRRPGLRVVGGWDRFETTVRVILGQQVSVAAASTLAGRLVASSATRLPADAGSLTHVFPRPDQLVELDPEALGLPATRVRSVAALARAVLDGRVDLHAADPAAVRTSLLSLPGVGPWTVEMALLRAVRDPDAFPASDLGLRRAAGRRLGVDEPVPASQLEALAEVWRPHRALAAQHLWSSLHHPDRVPGPPGTDMIDDEEHP